MSFENQLSVLSKANTLFLIVLFGFSCERKNGLTDNEYENFKKVNSINRQHVGKKLNEISDIISPLALNQSNSSLLLITNNLDCQSCRALGYEWIKRITPSKANVMVIGTFLNERSEKEVHGCESFFLSDDKEIIRNKLNLHHTPAIVALNAEHTVIGVLSIHSFSSSDNEFENRKFEEFLGIIFEEL